MEGENFNGKGGNGKRRVERIPGVRTGPLIDYKKDGAGKKWMERRRGARGTENGNKDAPRCGNLPFSSNRGEGHDKKDYLYPPKWIFLLRNRQKTG